MATTADWHFKHKNGFNSHFYRYWAKMCCSLFSAETFRFHKAEHSCTFFFTPLLGGAAKSSIFTKLLGKTSWTFGSFPKSHFLIILPPSLVYTLQQLSKLWAGLHQRRINAAFTQVFNLDMWRTTIISSLLLRAQRRFEDVNTWLYCSCFQIAWSVCFCNCGLRGDTSICVNNVHAWLCSGVVTSAPKMILQPSERRATPSHSLSGRSLADSNYLRAGGQLRLQETKLSNCS